LNTDPLRIGYREPDGREEVLAESDELIIQRGDRVAIVGPNGSGKTTALRTFVGEIPALKGTVSFGTNVKMAYYAQAHEGLERHHSALETILHDQPMGEEQARNLLGRFLFSNDDVYKPVSALSGGERSRLALARLSLENANFLILDEPTNHLDILARESLEEVLRRYDGTILFVSHDRYFIDRIANKVWSIEDGRVVTYLGNYTDMVRHREAVAAQGSPEHIDEPERVERESPGAERKQPRSRGEQRLLDRHLRDLRRKVAAAERDVNELEAKMNAIGDDLNKATAAQDTDKIATLGKEYEELQARLERAYATWTDASAELDEVVTNYALAGEE
ncbi:MAG: ATP-binding cassette domain-containing protein, partial [Chloroflexota bacterium]